MVLDKRTSLEGKRALLLPALALAAASVAGLLAVLAGFGSRFEWWHFRTGFTLLGYAAYTGTAAAVLALLAGIAVYRKQHGSGIALAVLALAGGLTVAAIPATWRMQARRLPAIHDITTDTVNPPQFVALLALRKTAPNPALYGGNEIAEQQKAAYPDLHSEILEFPANRAFERALAAAQAAGWHIEAAEPGQGRIEATATTFWFGFTDDIVIRIVAAGDRSLLDIRSVSRVGKSDVGTNAKRIRSYLERLRSYR